MNTSSVVLCAGIAGAVVSSASASPIDLAFDGFGMHRTISVHRAPQVSGALPDHAFEVAAGQNMWQVVDGGERFQSGTQVSMFTTALSGMNAGGSVRLGSLSTSTHLNPMHSAARAALLQNLYSAAHSQSAVSNAHAAAFQVAIWEIVHESSFSAGASSFAGSGLDVLHTPVEGGFWINTGRYGSRDPVALLANQWLESAWNGWKMGSAGTSLNVVTGEGFPEQLMMIMIPLPSAGGLAMVGLLGLGTYRRRRA